MADVERDVAAFNDALAAGLAPGRLPIRICIGALLQQGAFFSITVTVVMPS
jgi:hypothetical protein